MKKFMFTAIALVAFSSVSLAETISAEEVVKNNKSQVIIKKDYWGCAAIASNVYDEIYAIDPYAAQIEADSAFNDCMGPPCKPPFKC